MEISEEKLINQSLEENAQAFGELVERYKDAIYYHCFSLVKDEDAAEDIAQETFISAYYKLASYDRSRKFSTWLFKIATNKGLNYLKKNKRLIPMDDEYKDRIVSSHPTPHMQAERTEIHQIVDSLKPEYQAVISMYYWQGLDYVSIAEVMQVPEGTVKGWMSRAKESLRKELS